MALPAAAQAQLDALRSQNNGETPPVETPPVETPNGSSRTDGAESVTITRDEFNDLQAASGRVKAAEGRAEGLQMDVEALQTRLTALENASKGSSKGGSETPPSADDEDDWQPTAVTFTDQENTDYGESRTFIEKIVVEVLNRELPKVLSKIKSLKGVVGEVRGAVESTVRRTEQVEGRDFNDQVRAKLKESKVDFDAVTNHQHWHAFAQSEDPQTGYAYQDVLMGGVKARKVAVVARVMQDFAKKYGLVPREGGTGYEGGSSGGGSRLPESNDGPQNLPFSKRKEAHKKFINGEMTQSDYQRICDDYSKAEREGRIDYDA